jgi:gliding motility-associated-like protein
LHNAKSNRVRSILFFIALLLTTTITAQSIITIAGNGNPGYSGDGGAATAAELKGPGGIVIDPSGNLIFADLNNNVIRKISALGIITTIAGTGAVGYSGDGGPATAAKLSAPTGLVIDQEGNIFFSDQLNDVIRKISTDGMITTVAGINKPGYSGDGGPATAARLYIPLGMAIDKTGNIYFADTHNQVIRKIDKRGIITTVAGNGTYGYSGDGGAAINATLRLPVGVDVDAAGNLYIADSENNVIRKVNASGVITTIAGNGTLGYGGDGGPAVAATLNTPVWLRLDDHGNLFVPDLLNHVIRKIDPSGLITTVAGSGISGYSGDGGDPLKARLNNPTAVACDNTGVFYISDAGNNVVRKVNPCKEITSFPVTIVASSGDICANDSVFFSASVASPALNGSYVWTINGQPVDLKKPVIELNGLKNGDKIQCLYSSGLVCSGTTASEIISVSVHPLPIVDLEPEVFIEQGGSIQLHAKVATAVSKYEWSPSTGLNNPSIADPVAAPVATTIYSVQVTSDFGCKAAGNIKVTISRKLYMPDGFTPNNDGVNDVFRIPAGTGLRLKKFCIYDRWGQMVFSTNDISKGWDGTVNGIKATAGVYVYVITASDYKGESQFKGGVVLIR